MKKVLIAEDEAAIREIIGITLRKLNRRVFCDLPGIIMPSMGLAMLGLIGIVNML